MILSGEGGKIYLLELTWNEGGELHESVRDVPGELELVREHLAMKPMYAVSLDTFYGWQPFHISPMLTSDE